MTTDFGAELATPPAAPAASACEVRLDSIEIALLQGRNAVPVRLNLVDVHGYSGVCFEVIFEALKDFGRRTKYSVFECNLEEKVLAELLERLDFEIDPRTDSCRLYRLCEGCVKEVRILGKGDRYEAPGFVIV